jgi:hypothetical protein
MAKKRRRVAPPPVGPEWDLTYLDMTAEDGWNELCQKAPGPSRTAFDHLRKDPRMVSNRQHRLRADFATKSIGGVEMEQWQYEVLGGARLWYAIDDAHHTIIMTHAGVGHPKQTE